MLSSALAYFFSLVLTVVLGGLLSFLIKAVLALVFVAFTAMLFSSGKRSKTYTNESYQVLTIEFLSNIFYGYLSNSIGIWVFNYMGVQIDWFYPVFMLVAFLWSDLTRMRNEQKQIEAADPNDLQKQILMDIISSRTTNGEELPKLPEMNKSSMISVMKNTRMTALFGKIAGVIIGGLQLIVRAA